MEKNDDGVEGSNQQREMMTMQRTPAKVAPQ